VHIITHWLSWSLRSGNSILIGRDKILGFGNSLFLSQDILSPLHQQNITLLYQAKGINQSGFISMQWKESGDLGLVEEVTKEWALFCRELIGVGVKLHDRSDELKWIGGDKSSLLYVKNVYDALASTIWQKSFGGWRISCWKWNLALKIKLFMWLAVEKKY